MFAVLADEKRALRTRLRARRMQRPDAERGSAANAIAEQVVTVAGPTPSVVGAYLSRPHEPGTGPALAALARAGHAAVVPRVDGDHLEWVEWTPGAATVGGAFGIAEPIGPPWPGRLATVDVVFLPALAVDAAGHRLGQGGGYYDRALANLPPHRDGGPLRVAVVFDDELLDAVPHESHDALVDVLLTPSTVHVVTPPTADTT